MKIQKTIVLYAICLALALSGCFGRSSKQTASQKSDAESTDDVSKNDDSESNDKNDKSTGDNNADADNALSTDQPSDASSDAAASDDPQAAPDVPEEFGVERICMLTEKGPVLIDLWLTIDGTSHREALSTLIQSGLIAADTDADGKPTWDELTQSDQFRYGRTGNLEIRSEEDRAELVRMYDSDRDGIVDEDELPRFMTRNAGGSRPFSLRSSNYFRHMNRIDSPIRRLLDQDRNGIVSKEELAAAATILRSRDADQNDILLPNEFLIDEEAGPSPLTLNRPSNPDSVVWISDVRQWPNFHYTLRERYALGGKLVASQFAAAPSLFAQLDVNDDAEIATDEIVEIANVDPHLILAVRFGTPELSDPTNTVEPGPLLELVYAAAEILAPGRSTPRQKPGRITIPLADTVLIVFAYDAVGEGSVDAQVAAQFGQLDGDDNGYLEEKELPEDSFGLPSFAALDVDEDGKVFEKDILAFLESRQTAWRVQVRGRAGEAPDALFTALDSNDDGRLTTREIHNADRQLGSFDVAKDGLAVSEIPDVMLLGVVRGDPQGDDGAFRQAMVASAEASEDVPDWFSSMDRNSDGDISKREFLGDEHQFQQLDRNDDQFVSAAELAEADQSD